MLLRQLSYVIKKQLKAPIVKGLCLSLVLHGIRIGGFHAIKPGYFSRQDWAEAGVHGSHRSGVQHSHWSGSLDLLSSDWFFYNLDKLYSTTETVVGAMCLY